MKKKILKNQRGLTLVEILAVIVILGIIAAIAIPSIVDVIENTKAVQILDVAKIARNENPNTASVDPTSLAPFIEYVKGDRFDVTNTESVFTISEHDVVWVADTGDAISASEDDLIDYIDGN